MVLLQGLWCKGYNYKGYDDQIRTKFSWEFRKQVWANFKATKDVMIVRSGDFTKELKVLQEFLSSASCGSRNGFKKLLSLE